METAAIVSRCTIPKLTATPNPRTSSAVNPGRGRHSSMTSTPGTRAIASVAVITLSVAAVAESALMN